jgi:hypothetical protein
MFVTSHTWCASSSFRHVLRTYFRYKISVVNENGRQCCPDLHCVVDHPQLVACPSSRLSAPAVLENFLNKAPLSPVESLRLEAEDRT